MNCDQAKENFTQFIKQYDDLRKQDLTESDTRSKIIDYIFINILGWEEKDILREGHTEHGFFDYRISLAGFDLIIEAKKQLIDFILPNTNRRKIKIRTIYDENKEIIDQVRNYLDDTGCDLGIITNGRQFIIGKFFNVNGKPWKDNLFIVYKGLQEISDNFIEFWNNLSKEAIINNGGINLLQLEQIGYTKTILSTIPEKDNEITRNDIASKIAPLISKVFGEIFNNDNNNDDIEFIKECFVENKEVIKNKAELNGLFSDDAPLLGEIAKAKNHKSIIEQVNKEIISFPSESKDSPTPKPIIIIGSKGAGKTTFINYLFRQSLSNDTISNYPYLYVNFMKYYKGNTDIDFEEIANDAIVQFNERYPQFDINSDKVLKRIYIKEIREKDKGIWKYWKENDNRAYQTKLSLFLEEKTNNKQAHLEALNLYFTREIHKRIIIIFDNADQLDDEIQEKVFLYSCSLNTKARYGVFISLREGYYYKRRNMPPFNAFESNVYHIAAPDYGIVLQKRIDFAIKCINNEKNNSITGYGGKGMKITLEENKIEEFFEGLRGSLFGDNNSPILEFIRHTTFPNVREGLRLFKTFLISGYTDVEEYILRVVFNNGQHLITIPIHEFAQTIGLENKLYYNHLMSNIQNLFFPCQDSMDYFLKIWILKRLEEQLKFEGNVNKYLSYDSFIEEFCSYGYKENVLHKEVQFLLLYGFVDTDKMISDIKWEELPLHNFSLTITSKGFYYVQNIINRFYYIELVLQDTPIFFSEDFVDIRSAFPMRDSNGKRDMRQRLKVVDLFLKYLEKRESNLQPIPLKLKYGSIVSNIKANGLNADIERINSINITK